LAGRQLVNKPRRRKKGPERKPANQDERGGVVQEYQTGVPVQNSHQEIVSPVREPAAQLSDP